MSEKKPYAGKSRGPRGAAQISEIANRLVDPVLARRAGISTELIGVWDEIAGESFADCTRPEKIAWPRRASEGDPGGGHEPGVLTVACEGARALFLSHRQGELIQRINGFFGFPAISRLRIVQKPVAAAPRRPRMRPLTGEKATRLKDMTDGIENEALKAALMRLGTGVMQKRGR